MRAICAAWFAVILSATCAADWREGIVRVCAADKPGAASVTTGTIIGTDKQTDTGLVLTCAHAFSDSGGMRSVVNVDLCAQGAKLAGARVVYLDPKNDVALVKVPLGGVPVGSATIAAATPPVGTRLISVGCSLGQPPTIEPHALETVSKYDAGALVSTNRPSAQGRSGGPLLNERGEIVGVLSASVGQQSFFASLPIVHRAAASVNTVGIVAQSTQFRNMDDVISCPTGNCPLPGQLPALTPVIDQEIVIDERIREPIRRYGREEIRRDLAPLPAWPVPRERYVSPEILVREWELRGVAAERLAERWAVADDREIERLELRDIAAQLRRLREVQRGGLVPRLDY